MKDLSIIVVSFNTEKMTVDAIKSVVRNTKNISTEIIVIDNASQDSSVKTLKSLAESNGEIVLITNKENQGFGRANNQGIKNAKGRYILLLNTDTLVEDNVLGEMVKWMDENSKVGVASCALKFKDGRLQATGGYFPSLPRVLAWMTFVDDLPGISLILKPFHPMHDLSPLGANTSFYGNEHLMDWVTGAFFMIRKEAAREIGYFDDDYFMYMEEVDYCFRAEKLGWEIQYLPKWSIIHFGGGSAGKEFSLVNEMKGLKLFYRKHMPRWQFPILNLLIKLGALLRIFVFGILKGGGVAKTYAKIFVSV